MIIPTNGKDDSVVSSFMTAMFGGSGCFGKNGNRDSKPRTQHPDHFRNLPPERPVRENDCQDRPGTEALPKSTDNFPLAVADAEDSTPRTKEPANFSGSRRSPAGRLSFR